MLSVFTVVLPRMYRTKGVSVRTNIIRFQAYYVDALWKMQVKNLRGSNSSLEIFKRS
jgi:hypothetical protein